MLKINLLVIYNVAMSLYDIVLCNSCVHEVVLCREGASFVNGEEWVGSGTEMVCGEGWCVVKDGVW